MVKKEIVGTLSLSMEKIRAFGLLVRLNFWRQQIVNVRLWRKYRMIFFCNEKKLHKELKQVN